MLPNSRQNCSYLNLSISMCIMLFIKNDTFYGNKSVTICYKRKNSGAHLFHYETGDHYRVESVLSGTVLNSHPVIKQSVVTVFLPLITSTVIFTCIKWSWSSLTESQLLVCIVFYLQVLNSYLRRTSQIKLGIVLWVQMCSMYDKLSNSSQNCGDKYYAQTLCKSIGL